jgi:glycosyltransferase involved in cell wall biosynthesis
MKIIQIHNSTKDRGGGEIAFEQISKLLIERNHNLIRLVRSNSELSNNIVKKIIAFVTGSFSISAYYRMLKIIRLHKPDIVHVHGIYPFFTPSILVACKKKNIPVLLHCHSFQLICPCSILFHENAICDLCIEKNAFWCVLKNCRKNIFESIAYALRFFIAKRFNLYKNNVDYFIAPTKFVKDRLILAGFNKDQIFILPNIVNMNYRSADIYNGQYVAFVGRLSPEKGIATLVSAAEQLPKIQFSVAGEGNLMNGLRQRALSNLKFLGFLNTHELEDFYCRARFIVVPSLCFETFCLVAAEAMSYGLPIIASNLGGLKELIDDRATGLLFKTGDVDDLIKKIRILWNNPSLCQKMGALGRSKVRRDYNEDKFLNRLMYIYEKTILKTASNKNI